MWLPRYDLRLLFREDIFFYTYRWLAWLLAAVVICMPGMLPAPSPLAIWLLVFTGVLNILATTMAHTYARVARRRPLILMLDVGVGVSLLWVSEGRLVPFGPYALSALVLPAAVLRWRGVLAISLAFVVLDQIGLLAGDYSDELAASRMMHMALPPAFAMTCLLLSRLGQTRRGSSARTAAGGQMKWPSVSRAARRERDGSSSVGHIRTVARSQRRASAEAVSPEPPQVALEAAGLRISIASHPGAAGHNQHMHNTGYGKPASGHTGELAAVLHQLVGNFSRETAVDLRMNQSGTTQQLSSAKRAALVKLAQAALLNIRQHAHAHSALMTLAYADGAVTLTIEDDGIGLLDGTYQRPGIHSLRAIHYRLTEFDGHLEVFEGEHGGVTVRGVLPISST